MTYRQQRHRPEVWKQYKTQGKHGWELPGLALKWLEDWVAYLISRSVLLEILEYLSSLGVLVAVILYFSGTGDRRRQRHLQMWQVLNTAQGKGGSGGRIEALQELNHDHVELVGVDVSGAFLQGVELRKAELLRANFSLADVRQGDFTRADLRLANLHSGNFRGAQFSGAQLREADCGETDFSGADLSGADLSGTDFADADLSTADLRNVRWQMIKNVKAANFFGVKNAPAGFMEWAMKHGAVQTAP
jgi:hypothetical protein